MDDLKYDILNEKMDKIDEKIDKILDHSANVDITLVGQALEIQHHIKRSNEIEKYVSLLEEDIKPIKNHILLVNGLVKGIITLISVGSAIAGILKYLKIL